MNIREAEEILNEEQPNGDQIQVQKVKIEPIKQVTATIDYNGIPIPVARIKEYGSKSSDLSESRYAKSHNGNYALLGKKGSFRPSKNHSVSGIANVTIDGTTWYFGISKTGMSEGI